jgi:hypothetical protein
MHKLVEDYTFNGLWRLVSKFHFLVALGPEYGGTKVLHKKILFQCNCHKYWKRCAYAHSLLVGTHLHERSGGFSAEHVPGDPQGTQLPVRCSRKHDPGTCSEKEDADASKIKDKFQPKH